MENYVVKGKIYKVFESERKTEKFSKQEFVIQVTNATDHGTFIDYLKFQCINDKMGLLRDVVKGDFVVCKFNMRGNKVGKKGEEERFFNNNDITDLVVVNKSSDIIKSEIRPGSSTFAEMFPGLEEEETDSINKEPDDLPF